MRIKNMILMILIIIIVLVVSFFVYNIYFKEEIVEVDFDVNVYSDIDLFYFQDKIECNLKDDVKIDTDELTKYQMITHCKDEENKKYKYLINIISIYYNYLSFEFLSHKQLFYLEAIMTIYHI